LLAKPLQIRGFLMGWGEIIAEVHKEKHALGAYKDSDRFGFGV